MTALDQMPGVEKTSLFGTTVHAVVRGREIGLDTIRHALVARGLEVQEVTAVSPSLEDVFLDVVDRLEARSVA
jgi:ABC-2 type transport system ATP-binding protein